MADELADVINAYPSFNITAVSNGSGTVTLTGPRSTAANVTITETMADAGNTVSGMDGGTDDVTTSAIDDQYTRPEAWRLLLRVC